MGIPTRMRRSMRQAHKSYVAFSVALVIVACGDSSNAQKLDAGDFSTTDGTEDEAGEMKRDGLR